MPYMEYEEYEAQQAARPHIILIDDTLDIDIKRMGLTVLRGVDDGLGWQGNDMPMVRHAKNKKEALDIAQGWKKRGITTAAILCDYKLRRDDGRDEWGTDTLAELHASGIGVKKLFLMSKSGFREEDKHKLDAIGAEYMHTYELLYAFAHTAENEAQKQACSQRASTSNFRQWCNEHLGKDYALNKYISPNVAKAERGMVPLAEVMKRLRGGAQDPAVFDMLDTSSLRRSLRARVDDAQVAARERIAIGRGIEGPSTAGRLAFGQEDVERIHKDHPGEPVILVLPREYLASDNNTLLAPENNIRGLVLLDRGTQHIAVLAENRNMPVLFANRDKYAQLEVRGQELVAFDGAVERGTLARAGEWLTLDGQSQELFAGKRDIIKPREQDWADVRELASIANSHASLPWHVKDEDDMRGLRVLVNADNAQDIEAGKAVPGIAGSGLVRTEHMFLEKEPMELLQAAIIAKGEKKQEALAQLTSMQERAIGAIYDKAGDKFPVKIRLLDAPAQEFLPEPTDAKTNAELAARLGVSPEEVTAATAPIFERKLRGAGFGALYEDIYKAQIDAIFTAAKAHHVEPHIMIPVLRTISELHYISNMVWNAAKKHGMEKNYKLGAMLETAQSVMTYDGDKDEQAARKELLKLVALKCDFVSFGTNDLTQEMLKLDRNDPHAVERWQQENREPINPFDTLNDEVKSAIKNTVKLLHKEAKDMHKELEVGLCGRQASDRATIEFCQTQRMHSISVAPTAEAMYQGMVEAGRTAVLTATEQREKLNAYMRKKREHATSLQAGKLPERAESTGRNIIDHADTVVVYIEDDAMQREDISQDLAHLPLVLCENINDGLNAIAALQSKGKKIVLITDMNVNTRHRRTQFAWELNPITEVLESHIDGYSSAPGVALANAVARGEVPGVSAQDTAVASMTDPPRNEDNFYSSRSSLDDSIIALSKKSDYYAEDCEAFIQERIDANKPLTPKVKEKQPDPVVLFVDDEREHCEMFRDIFSRTFGHGTQLRIAHNGQEALEQMRAGGVSLLLTDQLMPGMTGTELISALRNEGNATPAAIITQQPNMKGKPGHAEVPSFPKEALWDVEFDPDNRLRKFIAKTVDVKPKRQRWQDEFDGPDEATGGGTLGSNKWLR